MLTKFFYQKDNTDGRWRKEFLKYHQTFKKLVSSNFSRHHSQDLKNSYTDWNFLRIFQNFKLYSFKRSTLCFKIWGFFLILDKLNCYKNICIKRWIVSIHVCVFFWISSYRSLIGVQVSLRRTVVFSTRHPFTLLDQSNAIHASAQISMSDSCSSPVVWKASSKTDVVNIPVKKKQNRLESVLCDYIVKWITRYFSDLYFSGMWWSLNCGLKPTLKMKSL